MKKNIKWIIVGVLIVLFTILVLCVFNEKTIIFDQKVYEIVDATNLYKFFKYITEVGDIWILLLVVLISFTVTKKYYYAICTFSNLAGITVLNYILKNIFQRGRPEELFKITETGFSFPSGHTAVSTAFYSYILYLILKNCKNKWIKGISIITLPILIVTIGISRIYLGVHYPTDVIGGIIIGITYTIMFIHIVHDSNIFKKKGK
ncbi:MAG: phosphatase PAP2 family protein [Clostridia bacterium]|nr:phosphatase PAP2 family protein [Clostridia bacterium]